MGNESKSNPKKEYLLGKMIDGAHALYDFFEAMKLRDSDPVYVAGELKTKYCLTQSQQEYLDGVVVRTSKAKYIVRYLEKRFGLNEDGTFKDAKGLHKLLFNGYAPQRLEARSYNFGIGFTQGVWRKNDILGFKHAIVSEDPCLAEGSDPISKLEKGVMTDCRNLAFRIPGDTRMAKNAENRASTYQELTEEQRLYHAVFGGFGSLKPNELKQEVIDHELRHVIDELIGAEFASDFFVETQAHLYENAAPKRGIRRDFNGHEAKLQRMKKIFDEKARNGKEENMPDVITDNYKRIAENYQKKLDKLKSECAEILPVFDRFVRQRVTNGLFSDKDNKIKSYLFSTMPNKKKLFRRLSEMVVPLLYEIRDLEIDQNDRK